MSIDSPAKTVTAARSELRPSVGFARSMRPARRSRLGSLGRRLLTTFALLATLLGVTLATSPAANAQASTAGFYAECAPTAVNALAPDMGWYPNYTVVFQASLYRYTSAGWQQYRVAPSQSASGQNVGGLTGVWSQVNYRFTNLPRNWYYQVRVTYVWLGRGLNDTYHINVPVPHQNETGNFVFASYSRTTTSYCYTA